MRRGWAAALLVSCAAACGFPQLSYRDDPAGDASVDGAEGVDAASGDAAAEAGGGPDGGSPVDARQDETGPSHEGGIEASIDAAPDAPVDASVDAPMDGPVDAPVESGVDSGLEASADAAHESGTDAQPSCDVDGDGYLAKGGTCGGTDCCDSDPSAHPGQAMYFTSQDLCHSWDYDCSGGIETEYPTNITCAGTGLTGCAGSTGPGFTGNPACGASAPYSVCQGSGLLSCAAMSSMMAAQGCH